MDKYRVIGTLGVGGMGAVVAAEHLQLGNRVAIKFLLPNLVDNEMIVARFLQEAKAATRIQSEHVASVSDVGEMRGPNVPKKGIPFMVMEHLEGRDLAEWVKTGKKFSIADAIDFIVQAGEALAQAHKSGIIHRDIKPANLFLCERDERNVVKVLDFGISKLMDEGPDEMSLTKTTTVLGSGLYMSPEQMRSAKNVDFRTDIYSLGVCLFELLTGTQPHTAQTFSELCVKVNIDPPTPIRDYRPDIPEALADAIAMAYARKPDDRYQNIQELVAALAPFAENISQATIGQIQGITRHVSIVPPPPANPQLKSTAAAVTAEALVSDRSDSRAGIVLMVVFGIVLAAGGVGVFMLKQEAVDRQTPHASPQPPTTSAPTDPAATPARPSAAAAPPSAAPSMAELVTSASAGATAKASSRSVAPPVPPAPPATPPPPPPPPIAPPPPPCNPAIDPDTGLMSPCP